MVEHAQPVQSLQESLWSSVRISRRQARDLCVCVWEGGRDEGLESELIGVVKREGARAAIRDAN